MVGNIKTKPEIIRRELQFKENDTLYETDLAGKIKRSTENLLNTPLFNDVVIEVESVDSNLADIKVNVKERWYIWPEVSVYYVDRNFSNWLRERDLGRIDYGIGLVKYNFRGRNEKLGLYAFFGYDEELFFKYDNVFVDKHRNHAFSTEIDIKRRKETPFGILNDQVQQLQLENEVALKQFSGSLTYTYRNSHNRFHFLNLAYENRWVSDSLLKLNPEYSTNESSHFSFFSLNYRFLNDMRDSRTFPESGYKYDISLTKYGLFVVNEPAINSFKLAVDISFYSKLSERISLNNNMVLTQSMGNKNPFFLNTALGFDDNIRGYEYYAVNGRSAFISKNSINIKIVKKKYFNLHFLPYEKFNKPFVTVYANLFIDGAYIRNNDDYYNLNNRYQNTVLYGYGVGLVFLSYYDKLLRLEFAMNKQKIHGFYIHFETPF